MKEDKTGNVSGVESTKTFVLVKYITQKKGVFILNLKKTLSINVHFAGNVIVKQKRAINSFLK